MGPRYLKDGEDFTFGKDFGFTESAVGRHDAREHPQPDNGEYGDGSYVQNKARGGRVKKADGGSIRPRPKPADLSDPRAGMNPIEQHNYDELMASAKNFSAPEAKYMATNPEGRLSPNPDGHRSGGHVKKLAMGGPMMAPVGARPGMPINPGMARPGLTAAPAAPTPAVPAMAKGGKFIQKGIKHPGRMKALAKKHGRSLHDEMVHDKKSSSPSLRSAAVLGLRLTEGDLSHHGKKK